MSPGRAGWKCLESLFSARRSLEPSLWAYLEVMPAEEQPLAFTWIRVLGSRGCEFLFVAPDAGGFFSRLLVSGAFRCSCLWLYAQ